MFASSLSYTRIEKVAQAWLGAGATAVSVWDHHRMLQNWPAQETPDQPDFITPVRISSDGFGELRISGFTSPGRTERRSAAIVLADGSTVPRREDMIPDAPTVTGLDIFADSRPCVDVNGDYYDFVPQSSGTLAFSVADIAGKGLAAALLMPGMHRALRDSLQMTANATTGTLLAKLNEEVYPLFANTSAFATALLGEFDPVTRVVSYANAGHSPVIYRSAAGDIHLIQADNMPVGITKTSIASERRLPLQPGDIFVIGTDGLVEAKDKRGQMFGYERLLALVDALAHLSASEIGKRLLQEVSNYTGDALQCDDYTVMVLKGVV